MYWKTDSAYQSAILCFASDSGFLASLENFVLPDDRDRRLCAMRNCWIDIRITFLIIMFTPILRITAKDESIGPGERSIDLYTVEKMLESHLAGNGCSIAV